MKGAGGSAGMPVALRTAAAAVALLVLAAALAPFGPGAGAGGAAGAGAGGVGAGGAVGGSRPFIPFLAFLAAVCAVAAVTACCALPLLRRPPYAKRRGPRRRFGWVVAGIGTFLVAGFAVAFATAGTPRRGLFAVLVVLFALPLPLVPWLYARTAADPEPAEPDAAGSLAAGPDGGGAA